MLEVWLSATSSAVLLDELPRVSSALVASLAEADQSLKRAFSFYLHGPPFAMFCVGRRGSNTDSPGQSFSRWLSQSSASLVSLLQARATGTKAVALDSSGRAQPSPAPAPQPDQPDVKGDALNSSFVAVSNSSSSDSEWAFRVHPNAAVCVRSEVVTEDHVETWGEPLSPSGRSIPRSFSFGALRVIKASEPTVGLLSPHPPPER